MTNRILLLLTSLALWACTAAMTQAEDLKAFPEAESGFERHVIRLPELDNEDEHRVELIPGKLIEVDCNRHWFGGNWSRESIPGWGYSYFLLADVGGPASTMMACPPDEPLKEEFVRVNIKDPMVRYNSRLPIVVYAPQDIEVRYRIWTAQEEKTDTSVE
jgi:ecotin